MDRMLAIDAAVSSHKDFNVAGSLLFVANEAPNRIAPAIVVTGSGASAIATPVFRIVPVSVVGFVTLLRDRIVSSPSMELQIPVESSVSLRRDLTFPQSIAESPSNGDCFRLRIIRTASQSCFLTPSNSIHNVAWAVDNTNNLGDKCRARLSPEPLGSEQKQAESPPGCFRGIDLRVER